MDTRDEWRRTGAIERGREREKERSIVSMEEASRELGEGGEREVRR